MMCPSVCQSCPPSVSHTIKMRSPSICPSNQLSDHHTMSKTSPSLCQSRSLSVCHNAILTSLSICKLQDLSVCYPTHDVIIPPIWPTVCLSSVTSILPSANFTVKMPMSIPVQNFPHDHNLGKLPFVHTSVDSSVHHSDSLSINSSLSAANPSKFPCNYGEETTVNYLHKNLLKSPTIGTSCIMSVIAPIHASSMLPICTLCNMSVTAPIHASSVQPVHTFCIMSVTAPDHASSVLSVHPYNNECQDFPDGFPGTKYGEKNLSEITVKFPHDITLTLQQAKFLEETLDTTKKVIYPGNFMLTQFWVKFMVINLGNYSYMLGVFQVTSHTMRCAHGLIQFPPKMVEN